MGKKLVRFVLWVLTVGMLLSTSAFAQNLIPDDGGAPIDFTEGGLPNRDGFVDSTMDPTTTTGVYNPAVVNGDDRLATSGAGTVRSSFFSQPLTAGFYAVSFTYGAQAGTTAAGSLNARVTNATTGTGGIPIAVGPVASGSTNSFSGLFFYSGPTLANPFIRFNFTRAGGTTGLLFIDNVFVSRVPELNAASAVLPVSLALMGGLLLADRRRLVTGA